MSTPPRSNGTILTVGGMLFQQALTFLTGVIVARSVGAADYGILAILRNITVALLALMPLGLDLALLKHVGRIDQLPGGPRRVLRILRSCVLLLNIALVAAVLAGLGTMLQRHLYTHEGFATYLLITLAGLPFAADLAILGACYRSLNRVGLFSLMTLFVQPAVRLAVTVAVLAAGWGVLGVVYANVAAFAASALMVWGHLLAWRPWPSTERAVRAHAWSEARAVLRESVWMALNLFVYSAMRVADVLLLGAMAPSRQVGEYGALSAVAQLVQVYPFAMAQTLGPRIAQSWRAGDIAGMRGAVDAYLRRASLVGGFVFGGVAIFGDRLDLVFGPSFSFRSDVAMAMALGWLISAVLGPTGYCLSMTGRHRAELAILVLGALALVGLCLLLIPPLGQLGAAVAVAVALALVNVVRAFVVARQLRFVPGRLADILPPIVGVLLALLAKVCLEQIFGRVFLASLLACMVYAVLYGAFALGPLGAAGGARPAPAGAP